MKNRKLFTELVVFFVISLLITSLVFAHRTAAEDTAEAEITETEAEEETQETEEETSEETEAEDVEEKTEVDITDATFFEFSDTDITVTEGIYAGYQIDDTSLTIEDSGIYVVSGSCENGTIVVKKNVTEVILVLDELELSASATAPLTCGKESEVCIFVTEDTVNSLSDDEYNNDDEYTDEELYPDIENAVIKCKDGAQVTICGCGTLQITANGKNGIKSGADIYEEEEDEEGNITETLIASASLTIKEVTLEITAEVNDALKADQELNLLSGDITITSVDDGIKSDYVLNIGEEEKAGPAIEILESNEGIEAAELNIYSGDIIVNAEDDGINAANSDLEEYEFSYNQYGGNVYINVTDGDGIDSNGTINLSGGTLEIYSPSAGDGDPLDSEYGTYFEGTTVLAVGHLGMPQGYRAEVPYVVFGGAFGEMGGHGPGGDFGRRGGFNPDSDMDMESLVSEGSTVRILDSEGEVLYEAEALRAAGYILFSCPELEEGAVYTLEADEKAIAEAEASMETTAGMNGRIPAEKRGEGPDGTDNDKGPFPGDPDKDGMPAPPENGGGQMPAPPTGGEQPPAPPAGGQLPAAPTGGEQPPAPGNENSPAPPEDDEQPSLHENDTPIG